MSAAQPNAAELRAGDLAQEREEQRSSAVVELEQSEWVKRPLKRLAQALVFGLIFGFLLQKGGVAKFHILVGVLLLQDFTVVKVMLSAIVTGMIGVYFMSRAGLIELQPPKTAYGANILGGLIFGVGFGLLAYCPGTNAAALGQGNYDALLGVAGMMAGSYLFALTSGPIDHTIMKWGDRGKLTLPDAIGVKRGLFVALAAPALVIVLIVLEWLTAR